MVLKHVCNVQPNKFAMRLAADSAMQGIKNITVDNPTTEHGTLEGDTIAPAAGPPREHTRQLLQVSLADGFRGGESPGEHNCSGYG